MITRSVAVHGVFQGIGRAGETFMRNHRKWQSGEKRLFVWTVLLPVTFVIAVALVKSPGSPGPEFTFQSAATNQLVAFPKPWPTPHPNGLDYYVKAGWKFVPFQPPVDAVLEPRVFGQVETKRIGDPYNLTRRLAWLKANSSAFGLIQKASRMPCLNPLLLYHDPEQNGLELGVMEGVGWAGESMAAKTDTLKLQGEWAPASDNGIDAVQMGVRTLNGGSELSEIATEAIMAETRDSLQDVPQHLNSVQAMAAVRRIESIDVCRPLYPDILRHVKVWYQGLLAQEMNSTAWRDKSEYWQVESSQFTAHDQLELETMSKPRLMDKYTAWMDAQILMATRPYPSGPRRPQPSDHLTQVLATIYKPWGYDNWLCDLRLLELRLALGAYFVDHGAYPIHLTQLVPEYLSCVPADPFGTGTLQYRKEADGYRAWSVGPDGVDNGGTPIPPCKALEELNLGDKDLADRVPESRGDVVVGPNGPIQ